MQFLNGFITGGLLVALIVAAAAAIALWIEIYPNKSEEEEKEE